MRHIILLLLFVVGCEAKSPQEIYVERMMASHRRIVANAPDDCVVFLGDSHIQGLCVAAVCERGINLGIGSDTSEGLLARVPRYMPAIEKAECVVICIGINDPVDMATGKNLAAIARLISRPVIYVAPMPARIARQVEVPSGWTAIDTSDIDSCGADGVHLAPDGYAELIERLRAELDSHQQHLPSPAGAMSLQNKKPPGIP